MSGAAATSGSGSLLKPMTRSNGISATTASGASRCAYDSRGGACDPSAACSSSSFSRPPAPGVPAPPAPTSLPASAATPPAPAPGVATATDGSGPVRIAVLDVSWTVASPPPTWTSLGRPKDPEVEVEVDVEVGRTLPATWVIVAPAVPGRAVQMATDQASTDAAPPCCDTMSAPTPTRAPPMNPTARPPLPVSAERSASSRRTAPTTASAPPTLPGMPSNGLLAAIRTHPVDGRQAGLSEVTTTWYRPWTAPRWLGLTLPWTSFWSVKPDCAGIVSGQNSAFTSTFPSGPGPEAARIASSSMPTTMAWAGVAAASSGTPLIANVHAPAATTIPGSAAARTVAADMAAAALGMGPRTSDSARAIAFRCWESSTGPSVTWAVSVSSPHCGVNPQCPPLTPRM